MLRRDYVCLKLQVQIQRCLEISGFCQACTEFYISQIFCKFLKDAQIISKKGWCMDIQEHRDSVSFISRAAREHCLQHVMGSNV